MWQSVRSRGIATSAMASRATRWDWAFAGSGGFSQAVNPEISMTPRQIFNSFFVNSM